ncbi:MAG: glycosyltransferase family 9 protein [Anaerolineales bacterium]|nr:glycosyltransferase family 9 protein [Anaerolineales bacterium]
MSERGFWYQTANRLASVPFRLQGAPAFQTPKRVVILQPGWLSQVMLTTPLLAVLSDAFPEARFDWAVSRWARPAIATNPRLNRLIELNQVGQAWPGWGEIRAVAARLKQENYDTCFIPHRSRWLGLAAWLAGIPQRIGLDVDGAGFAHTIRVQPPAGSATYHETTLYLLLAKALGIEKESGMEFYPSDQARTTITQRLVDEWGWQGEVPLVLFHPGGGVNPDKEHPEIRWPVERFALLGNHLKREYEATILVLGSAGEEKRAAAVAGLMSGRVHDLSGKLSLNELGALGEVASLYVGNDTGPTHIAAAVGCPTLVIYGPSSVGRSRPFVKQGHVMALPALREAMGDDDHFSWSANLNSEDAIVMADQLLRTSIAELQRSSLSSLRSE